mmetsp:Transcript_31358/g.100585  ORF Transcript_31358/g.100585 Transcript_31358/m.100585 type:complete len:321 (+) Transcript_31358:836-1798(+)
MISTNPSKRVIFLYQHLIARGFFIERLHHSSASVEVEILLQSKDLNSHSMGQPLFILVLTSLSLPISRPGHLRLLPHVPYRGSVHVIILQKASCRRSSSCWCSPARVCSSFQPLQAHLDIPISSVCPHCCSLHLRSLSLLRSCWPPLAIPPHIIDEIVRTNHTPYSFLLLVLLPRATAERSFSSVTESRGIVAVRILTLPVSTSNHLVRSLQPSSARNFAPARPALNRFPPLLLLNNSRLSPRSDQSGSFSLPPHLKITLVGRHGAVLPVPGKRFHLKLHVLRLLGMAPTRFLVAAGRLSCRLFPSKVLDTSLLIGLRVL